MFVSSMFRTSQRLLTSSFKSSFHTSSALLGGNGVVTEIIGAVVDVKVCSLETSLIFLSYEQ